MQIDWQRAINDILGSKLSCPRCGTLADEVMIGYLRTPEAAQIPGTFKKGETRLLEVKIGSRVELEWR